MSAVSSTAAAAQPFGEGNNLAPYLQFYHPPSTACFIPQYMHELLLYIHLLSIAGVGIIKYSIYQVAFTVFLAHKTYPVKYQHY